jgi:pimeloyl-ACP methyl ester carboxylesterase
MSDGLLLVHAFPMDASMWEPQVRTFGNRIRVAAPDLPGFGTAPGVGRVMSMGAAADRCLQAAEAAGLERFVVCGLSMGGYVAMELWRMARQRIDGMILANTRSGADTPEAAAGRRALAERLEAEGNGFLVAEPPPLLGPEARPALRALVRETIAAQAASSIAAAALGMAERLDSTPDLGTIDVPVLVVTGEVDTLIPPAVTLEMVPHLHDVQTVTIPGAGHLSNLEAPEAFDGAIASFLAELGLSI